MASPLALLPLLASLGAQGAVTSRGPVLGLDLGQAGLQGDGATVFETPGWGKAIVLGYRFDQLGLEWHIAQSYHLDPVDPAVEGDLTQGSLKLSTVGVRYTFLRRHWLATGFAGMTRASLPLLVIDPDLTSEGNVSRDDLLGVGPLAGLGLGLPLPGTALQVFVEGRTAWCAWEQPLEYIATIDTSGGTSTWQTSTDALDPKPWTLVLSLRAVL